MGMGDGHLVTGYFAALCVFFARNESGTAGGHSKYFATLREGSDAVLFTLS